MVQQTSYQKGISCEDATVTVFETLSYLMRNGNTVFQTFYNLEKAFDGVEYIIHLKHLHNKEVNGKCWRIIRSYYEKPVACVKINESLSPEFTIEHGVRQGQFYLPAYSCF